MKFEGRQVPLPFIFTMSSSISYTIPRGNFSDLGLDKESAYMLSRAYTIIDAIPGAWDILARPDVPGTEPCGYCGFKVERRPDCRVCDGKGIVERGFMFNTSPILNEIGGQVGNDPEMGHSGSSYAWTMRNMESIAKNGWENYTKKFPRRKLYATPEDVLQAQLVELTQRVKTLEAENEALKPKKKSAFPYPCPCHLAKGLEGWCGVAGGGVPGCEH
jgi:hypothetical protein